MLFGLLLVLPAPEGLSAQGWTTAAVAVLMAVWWISEAVPIPVTALLPLVLFPGLGILSAGDAAAPYAHDLIFLFMGGFMIAAAMERWGLHKRMAFAILGATGSSPERLVLGFMLSTAFVSMWISNTATTAMMLPVGTAVASFMAGGREGPTSFGACLMLGIAYAASIGGVATLIGTAPNAVVVAAADELLGVRIGFVQWMMVGVPVTLVMLPLTWFLLVKVLHPPGEVAGDGEALIAAERAKLGPRSRGENGMAVVFVLTALAWVLRAPKTFGSVTIPGLQTWLPEISDSTIAMGGALLLFMWPVDWRKGRFLLEWAQARRIPWGVLVLFGGGLSLARAMDRSGLAAWIGGGVEALGSVPTPVLILGVAGLFVFLTEVTSNTATTTMAMPIMAGVAVGLSTPALPLMIAAGVAASMAFMLPVATPPNAIVFGSEHISIPIMARAGFALNFVSILVVTLAVTFLVPVVLAGLL